MIALTFSACYLFNPNTDPPAQVEACSAGVSPGDTKPNTREVALGTGHGNDFDAYLDGSNVTSVTGGQGSTMITPVVRVKAESGDPSEACFLVEIVTEDLESIGGGGSGGGGGECFEGCGPLQGTQGAKMKLEDGYYYTDGVIYNPIESGHVKLTLTVTGEDFSGTTTVEVYP